MEWNRRNILIIIAILVLGFGSGGVMYVREEGGVNFVAFRVKRWASKLYEGSAPSASLSEKLKAKREAEKVSKLSLKLYPDLKIEAKPVPDHLNGFLALLEAQDDSLMLDFVRSDITRKIDEPVIDEEVIQRDLKSHEAILVEIERIAALPERSSENLPVEFTGFLGARDIKTMGDYLMLKARLAAMYKDEKEAFKFVSLAMNLTKHLEAIESPSLLSESVVILLRLHIQSYVMEHILPAIGQSADLLKWRELLKPRDQIADRFIVLLKGEFKYFQKQWAALVFISHYEYAIPDPEAVSLAYAAYVDVNVKNLYGMSFDSFASGSLLPTGSFTKGLSKEGSELLSTMTSGFRSWNKGMVRSYVVESQFDAVLDLLIREKAGEDLSKMAETFVMNPLTKKPFVYDPVGRLLPEDKTSADAELREINLPW